MRFSEDLSLKSLPVAFFLLILILWSANAGWAQTADTFFLFISFPAKNDTFALDKLRIGGGTQPGAQVFINEKSVRVYENGAFVDRVDLFEGSNQIFIRAEKDGQQKFETIQIYRPPKVVNTPQIPTQIDTAMMEPRLDVWKLPGDYLAVVMKGSPGGSASFEVEGLTTNAPMVELDPENAWGLTGVYQGVVRIKAIKANKPHRIVFALKGNDGRLVKKTALGRLVVLPDRVPIVAETKQECTLHASFDGYNPITRLLEATRVQIIGKAASRLQVRFDAHLVGYVETLDMTLLPLGTPLPRSVISAPTISLDRDWYQVSMTTDRRVPFRVEQIDGHILDWYCYNVTLASHWTSYPSQPMEIRRVQVSSLSEGAIRVRITLDQKQLWGYKVRYEKEAIRLYIRRSPELSNSLKNMIIAIDPGHGGDESGAKSATGILEKDINLVWAKHLADKFRDAGATVILTRSSDETVSLQQRVKTAEDGNAHLFLSLHNNSTTPSGNPLAARGTSVYFSLPHQQALAWAVYPYLIDLGLLPYGRISNSYYVTNATSFVALLVEGGFLTHPVEEQMLNNNTFLQRMALAVFNGVEQFVARLR